MPFGTVLEVKNDTHFECHFECHFGSIFVPCFDSAKTLFRSSPNGIKFDPILDQKSCCFPHFPALALRKRKIGLVSDPDLLARSSIFLSDLCLAYHLIGDNVSF
jgi:hypothetical protein